MCDLENVDMYEIVFCHITCRFVHNKKMITHVFENVLWKNEGKRTFYRKKTFDVYKIPQELPILKLVIIKRLGFANASQYL